MKNTRSFLVALSALAWMACSSSGGSPSGTTVPESGAEGGNGSSTSGGGASSSGSSSSGVTASTSSSGGSSSGGSSSSGAGTGPSQSVLQRGNDLYRRSTFNQPGLTLASAPMMAPDTMFDSNATFPQNGNTLNQGTASVLYLENGPPAAGCPAGAAGCAATPRPAPNVCPSAETTGRPVWTAHITAGGDGIRGTPVVDPTTRRLFIVTGGNPHLVHALSADTGVEATTGGWPVTLSNATVSYNNGTGTVTFNSGAENQHGASLLLNNILYIPFGGEYGDGGNYLGWIIAVDTTNPTKVAGWATQSPRSGLWGSPGLASDGTGVLGVTGDTDEAYKARNISDSEEIVRVTGMAAFARNAANVFAPTEALSWDRPADLDFCASSPAFTPLPAGSTLPSVLVAPSKAGRVFILNGANLSNGVYDANRTPGGELANIIVSGLTGETIYTAPTIYTSASGLHATINVGGGAQNCPGGNPAGQEVVMSLLIPANPANTSIQWCTANGSGGGHMNFVPISTTSDGVSANAIVWFISGTQLVGLNGDTGAKLVTTTGAACTGIPSMSFLIAAKNRIVVSALGHLCSWSVGGT